MKKTKELKVWSAKLHRPVVSFLAHFSDKVHASDVICFSYCKAAVDASALYSPDLTVYSEFEKHW